MYEAAKLARKFSIAFLKQPQQYNPSLVVFELIKANNISYETYSFRSDKCSGSLIYLKQFNNFSIVVNKNHIRQRRLFTTAHELGHYFLHRNKSTGFICNVEFRSKYRKVEFEANIFAAELLMPLEIVTSYLSRNNFSLWETAKELGVSYEAMKWRFINLLEDNQDVTDFGVQRIKKMKEILFDEGKYDYQHRKIDY